jgi:hypothetical protein
MLIEIAVEQRHAVAMGQRKLRAQEQCERRLGTSSLRAAIDTYRPFSFRESHSAVYHFVKTPATLFAFSVYRYPV